MVGRETERGCVLTHDAEFQGRPMAARRGATANDRRQAASNPARLNPALPRALPDDYGRWSCNHHRPESLSEPSSRALPPLLPPNFLWKHFPAPRAVYEREQKILLNPLEPVSRNLKHEIPSGFVQMTVEAMPRTFRKLGESLGNTRYYRLSLTKRFRCVIAVIIFLYYFSSFFFVTHFIILFTIFTIYLFFLFFFAIKTNIFFVIFCITFSSLSFVIYLFYSYIYSFYTFYSFSLLLFTI